MTDYLIKINKYLGSWVYQNIIEAVGSNIVIKKELTLDELHIYGSSRHGIHKPKLTLVNNTYRINKLDSATDSTQAYLNFSYFKRTLTYKQYELTNHLGNVLATVLDRKTAVTDSTGGDTLMYYIADVYTAGLYYAFGSGIEEFEYSSDTTSRYRYGFNGMEHDNESFTDAYDFGARIYDGRLVRWLALDPLMKKYPNVSPYCFTLNNPIYFVDPNGEIVKPWYVCKGEFVDHWINFNTNEIASFMTESIESLYLGNSYRVNLFKSAYEQIKKSERTYFLEELAPETEKHYLDERVKGYFNPIPFAVGMYHIKFKSPEESTVFEEIFHAAQNDYALDNNYEINPLMAEIEAKLAKLINGTIGSEYERKGLTSKNDFGNFVLRISTKQKLHESELSVFKDLIKTEFAPSISKMYSGFSEESKKIYNMENFDISQMKYLGSLLGINFGSSDNNKKVEMLTTGKGIEVNDKIVNSGSEIKLKPLYNW